VGVQADGTIVLAGAFNALDGLARNGLARLNADGTVDSSFNAGALLVGGGLDSAAFAPDSALTISEDGKLPDGGSFFVDGASRPGLARMMTTDRLTPRSTPGQGCHDIRFGSRSGSVDGGAPDASACRGYFTAVNGVRARVGTHEFRRLVDTAFDRARLWHWVSDFGPLAGLPCSMRADLVAGASSFQHTLGPGCAVNADGSLDGTIDPPLRPASPRRSTNAGSIGRTDSDRGSFYKVEPEFRSGLARMNLTLGRYHVQPRV